MDISDSNSSKKRRIHREKDEGEEEEEDEAKMETFFALVKSIRESRDRWISFRSGDHSSKNKRSKNIVKKEENRVEVWKPTFQLEDFAQEDLSVALLAGSSQSNNCHKEEDAEKGIDLKLSL